jgi:hypothetical protein
MPAFLTGLLTLDFLKGYRTLLAALIMVLTGIARLVDSAGSGGWTEIVTGVGLLTARAKYTDAKPSAARRPDGLPHMLPALLMAVCLAMASGGCVNAAVKESAHALYVDLGVYGRATVPDPRYTPAEAANVDLLEQRLKEHAVAIYRAAGGDPAEIGAASE